MNLADMLSYSDIAQLSNIAKHYDCDCNQNSKRELIQSILLKINQREVYEQMVAQMSIEELRFLNSLIFEKSNATFSLEELVARAKLTRFTDEHEANWNPRDVIAKFKQRGWLFNGYSSDTKYLFLLPQDLMKTFSELLADRLRKSIIVSHEPTVYRDEQSLIHEDIIQFLNFLLSGSISLTVEGYMYKQALTQLLNRMAVREDIGQQDVWRFGYGRRFKRYPNRFSFIYDYCYYKRYIVEQNDQLSLTDKGRERLEETHMEQLASLFHYYVKLYSKPIRNLTSFAHWIRQLARHWVTVTSVKEALIPLIKPYYYDSPEMIFEKRIIQMMMHLGLIRIGHHEGDGYVMQMTDQGNHVMNETDEGR